MMKTEKTHLCHLGKLEVFSGDRVVLLGGGGSILRELAGLEPSTGANLMENVRIGLVWGRSFFPQGVTAQQMGRLYHMAVEEFSWGDYGQVLEHFQMPLKAVLTSQELCFACGVAIALSQNRELLLYESPEFEEAETLLATTHRLLRRSDAAVVMALSHIEEFPYWEDSVKLGISTETGGLSAVDFPIYGTLGDILAETAVCHCSLREIQRISPKDYVSKMQIGTDFRLLISKKALFSELYPEQTLEEVGLGEILEFFQ